MSDKREAIEKTAREFRDAARAAGNTTYTIDDARRRVARAVELGDRKRANGNR